MVKVGTRDGPQGLPSVGDRGILVARDTEGKKAPNQKKKKHGISNQDVSDISTRSKVMAQSSGR